MVTLNSSRPKGTGKSRSANKLECDILQLDTKTIFLLPLERVPDGETASDTAREIAPNLTINCTYTAYYFNTLPKHRPAVCLITGLSKTMLHVCKCDITHGNVMSVKLSAASLSMTCVHVDIYNRVWTAWSFC